MIKVYESVNRNKLHQELHDSGIETEYVKAINNTDMGCEIKFTDDTDMTAVQAVIDAHNPEPLPPQPTEVEILQQELAGTNAMLLEFMESMLM